jgi:hypothetical protein
LEQLAPLLSHLSAGGCPKARAFACTNPAIDREEAKVDKMIGSICRGC